MTIKGMVLLRCISTVFSAFLVCCFVAESFGQGSTSGLKPPKTATPNASSKSRMTTIIEIKLLAGGDGASLHSQQWLKILEPLDVSIQIQKPLLDDKPELKERDVGTLRYVTAIGTLDRMGTITFPGRSFSPSDGGKLKEWIDELRTYGARGSPDGQPLWGISKDHFNQLYESLTKVVVEELIDSPVRDAIERIPLPESTPLRWSQAALDSFRKQSESTQKVRQEVQGFSAATALALVLNGSHLGFRPNRTPTGRLELLIEPLGLKDDQWPVGWPIQQQRIKAAPKFFSMTVIELDQVSLEDVFLAVSELTEVPVMVDYHELDNKNIDAASLKVSFNRRSTSWGVALKELVVPQKLSREIWQDEAGRVFVWITTNRPGTRAAQQKE